MREILFRSFNEKEKRFYYFIDGCYYSKYEKFTEISEKKISNKISERICKEFNWENVEQFIGITDKNGVKIFDNGQLLRIKGKMNDNNEYSYDCIYKTNKLSFDGFSISFVKLYSELPDSKENSYPINNTMTFRRGELCERDGKLNVAESWGENHLSRQRWKKYSKSSDIEVIGNIHENK